MKEKNADKKATCDNCDKEFHWNHRMTGDVAGKRVTVCSFTCQDEIILKAENKAKKAL